MTAVTGREAHPARGRSRSFLLALRLMGIEVRHSAFVWALSLLAVLFVYDPFLTASHYPALWSLRGSVVLDKFWPVCVPFAAGFSAWAGSREGRRNADELLAATPRPAWTRQLCSLTGTLAWVLAAFGAGVAVLYVRIAQAATWGGPPLWPVAAGAVSLMAACALAFTLGALFPGRFTAPIVAVAISALTLAVFSRAVSEGGTSVFALSPDGIVPGNDADVFYPVAPGVSIVQVMFFGGCTLGAVGLLGLSPRIGGAGWRGALDLASGGGTRLRAVATAVFAAGIALAVIGFGLAATARVSPVTGGVVVPALDGAPGKPIPYTPVCADASGGFRVCLHPARLRDGFRQDIVHAVIVGPAGHMTADGGFQQDLGTPAQQAVVDGLLKAIGSQPYPVYGPDGNPVAPPGPVTAAAARFAALPAATRQAWLAANLAALKAGHTTLARIP